MKFRKAFFPVTATLAVALALVPWAGSGLFGALALPFTALGGALRALSLSGTLGNIAAIVIWLGVSCIPLAFWWKSRRAVEDGLLVLLVPVTAVVLYFMVNPNLRSSIMQNEVGDVIYAASFWSTLTTWGILKLVRSPRVLEGNIYTALRIFLLLCAVSCLFDCFGTTLSSFLTQLKRHAGQDYGWGVMKAPTMIFLVLDYVVFALEDGLMALALWKGAELLEHLERDPFGEDCIAAADALSRRCRENLVVISLAALSLNLGQLLMGDMLTNVQVAVTMPVMGMAVCFAMLAVTKLLVRGKELKDDNDLFV